MNAYTLTLMSSEDGNIFHIEGEDANGRPLTIDQLTELLDSIVDRHLFKETTHGEQPQTNF